ncbi:hypothetical protein JW968_06595 [Candidatus Woesearchaeota archaeon]|nr:hypothetical protein [Candidatus Woesearchaeota archaeon]
MGIFDFIRALFSRKKKADVTIAGLPSWFNERSSGIIDASIDLQKDIISDIKDKRQELKELTKEIESADIDQLNIPQNAKAMLSDNKKNYLIGLRNFQTKLDFLDDLDFSAGNFMSLKDSAEKLAALLEQFGEATGKPHYVLTQFFGDIMKRTATLIAGISSAQDKWIREFTDNEKVILALRISSQIRTLQKNRKLLAKAQADIGDKRQQIAQMAVSREKVKGDIERFFSNPNYVSLKRSKDRIQEIDSQIKQLDQRLFEKMDPLEKALKKYSRMHPDPQKVRLAECYLENRLEALGNDFRLHILSIAEDIREMCSQDKLDIDDKKKERILLAISQLDSGFLTGILKSFNSLSKEKLDLQESISRNQAMKDLKELEYRLEHVEQRSGLFEQDIGKLEKSVESLDQDNLVGLIRENVRKLLKTDLVIGSDSSSSSGQG